MTQQRLYKTETIKTFGTLVLDNFAEYLLVDPVPYNNPLHPDVQTWKAVAAQPPTLSDVYGPVVGVQAHVTNFHIIWFDDPRSIPALVATEEFYNTEDVPVEDEDERVWLEENSPFDISDLNWVQTVTAPDEQ